MTFESSTTSRFVSTPIAGTPATAAFRSAVFGPQNGSSTHYASPECNASIGMRRICGMSLAGVRAGVGVPPYVRAHVSAGELFERALLVGRSAV